MSSASISFPMLGDWSIDPPSSFTLFGHTFYWYGVIIACGFLLAVAYCMRRSREFGIKQDDLIDNLLFAVPLAIIGARAYYVIFYGHYHSFWDMCKIWEGGLAIYGGVIAAVLTVLAVCRVKKISALALLDLTSFGFLIGQSIGRWGNFMNREAYGYETDVFCRMGLTLNGETIYVHPTFLYESLWNLAGFIGLHVLSKKTVRKFDGQFFLYYVGWYGLGRVWIEGLRADSLYLGGTGVRVSQLLAGLAFLASLGILAAVLLRGRCSPEKLWVNRVAAMAGPEPEEAPAAEEEAPVVKEEAPAAEEEAPAAEEEAPAAEEEAPVVEEAPAAEEAPVVEEEAPAAEEEAPAAEEEAPAAEEEAPAAEEEAPAAEEEAPTAEEETPAAEEEAPAAEEEAPAVQDFADMMAWMDKELAAAEAEAAEAMAKEEKPEKGE